MHAARAWLDPVRERQRLKDQLILRVVLESEHTILTLGPTWRPEEVAHVAARVFGSDLPKLRPVNMDGTVFSMYELAHVAFYCTDFGGIRVEGSLSSELALVATRGAAELATTDWGWDLGTELVLAARFLSGGWPAQVDPWIRTLLPQRASAAASTLREHPEAFLRVYHPMVLSAVALARADADGRATC